MFTVVGVGRADGQVSAQTVWSMQYPGLPWAARGACTPWGRAVSSLRGSSEASSNCKAMLLSPLPSLHACFADSK